MDQRKGRLRNDAGHVRNDVPDTPDNVPDIPGNVPDIPGNVPDIPGNVPDIPGNVPGIPGNAPDIPDNAPDIPDNAPDISDNAPDIPGNVPGIPDDAPGRQRDARNRRRGKLSFRRPVARRRGLHQPPPKNKPTTNPIRAMTTPLRWNQPGLKWNSPGLRWNGSAVTPPQKTMNITQIVLNIDNLTDDQIKTLLETKAQILTENAADFPTPSPTAAELTAKAAAIAGLIATAKAKEQEAKAAFSVKDTGVEEGRQMVRDLAAYVVQKKLAPSVAEKLFNLKKQPTPTTSIGPVLGLSATFGDKAGEIDLAWEPVAKARTYQVEWRAAGAPGAYTLAKSPTASKVTLKGLPSGQRVEIRVRAIGPKELEGEWSDSAEHLVP